VGSASAIAALDHALLVPVAAKRLVDDLVGMADVDVWEEQRTLLANLSEDDHEALRAQDRGFPESVYDSQLPTHRRIQHLRARPAERGVITPTAAGIDRAEAELAPLLTALAKRRRRRVLASMTPAELESLGHFPQARRK
jgi:hypothetical protein